MGFNSGFKGLNGGFLVRLLMSLSLLLRIGGFRLMAWKSKQKRLGLSKELRCCVDCADYDSGLLFRRDGV